MFHMTLYSIVIVRSLVWESLDINLSHVLVQPCVYVWARQIYWYCLQDFQCSRHSQVMLLDLVYLKYQHLMLIKAACLFYTLGSQICFSILTPSECGYVKVVFEWLSILRLYKDMGDQFGSYLELESMNQNSCDPKSTILRARIKILHRPGNIAYQSCSFFYLVCVKVQPHTKSK